MTIANTQRNKARRIAKEAARQPTLTRAEKADKELNTMLSRTPPTIVEPKAPRNHLFNRSCDNNALRQQMLDVKDKVPKFTVTYTPKPRTKRKHAEYETMADLFAAMGDHE